MGVLRDYLQGLVNIHATGEASEETSYYGQMENLLNAIGSNLSPQVMCVLTARNRGAGVPDGGLFIASSALGPAGRDALLSRAPERGVIEVKGPSRDVRTIARSAQVRRYLHSYGKVLVATYREFLVVSLNADGEPVDGERFSLAKDEEAFWAFARTARQVDSNLEAAFSDYLERALLGEAQLSQPADLAWFLAAYAREARRRLYQVDERHYDALVTLRRALEDALGLRFEGDEGEDFFRSALVQTLFYGVFAAWVVWSESQPVTSTQQFRWQAAQWSLNVPMVRVLFQQLATRSTLPVDLDEVLDWTQDTLNRVDRPLFFNRFESGNAVQYFYEPFLQAYDPHLRRQLGVWYTPPEVVRYMVGRVHQALQRDLGLPLGLADENVHVLDPCAGTGSFLVEVIDTIARVFEERHGDALVGHDAKEAALSRVHGFELLPAPFVVAHLNVGLGLARLGAPLSSASGERAGIYLTNALTGWVDTDEHPTLPYPEFEQEREAADDVKQIQPILVVLGNPPYNGYAGVSGREEGGLVEPYKHGLAANWDITKNKLDDLYVRFFRVAERRIAEQTGKGIVCFISNFSWLGDPSAVVMRQRLIREFDRIYIDNLNGDSRETGKKTPNDLPDPSVFSTRLNPTGIQVGTAVSLLIRAEPHDDRAFEGGYRDFWGASKRDDLEESLTSGSDAPDYEPLFPSVENWYRLRRWSPRQGYEHWPSVVELAADEPSLGLNENRGEALIAHDRETLARRMAHYLDPNISYEDLGPDAERLTYRWARFDPERTRDRLLEKSPFTESNIVRFQVKPFDLRWAYIDTTAKLWNEPRSQYVQAANVGSDFLLVRRRAPRANDGAAFLLSRSLIDQHTMHKDAYVLPSWLAAASPPRDDGTDRLFELDDASGADRDWRPNLSTRALTYLAELGIDDIATSQESARMLWLHVLAIGYSPLYLEENGDAIRNGWPRIPLPNSEEVLRSSTRLGQRIANLLDVNTSDDELDEAGVNRPPVARIARTDGQRLSANNLAVTAGWATEQTRQQRSGAVSRIVMPGRGRIEVRERTDVERQAFTDEEVDLLGREVVDVYLNPTTCWRGVPEAAWDFKIGGFQVLRKWLSYRERAILGRSLTTAEARQFTSMCTRLTKLILLGPQLDENYIASVVAPLSSPATLDNPGI